MSAAILLPIVAGRRLAGVAVMSLLALLVAGCTGGDKHAGDAGGGSLSAEAPITNTDPCAMRLHELSGALLLHYFNHFELPQDLAQLQPLESGKLLPPAVCPVTGAPYIYYPTGILLTEQQAYVVLYDSAPAHSRMRWAVTVHEPADGGETLLTKVIVLPESFFALHPPQRAK